MRTLYVEDNDITRELTTTVLEAAGLLVEAAAGGREACAAFSRAVAAGRPHELVLLDIQMPDMNGFEVARYVRSYPVAASVHVVLLTASLVSTSEPQQDGLRISATLIKPVTRKKLSELLQNLSQHP